MGALGERKLGFRAAERRDGAGATVVRLCGYASMPHDYVVGADNHTDVPNENATRRVSRMNVISQAVGARWFRGCTTPVCRAIAYPARCSECPPFFFPIFRASSQ